MEEKEELKRKLYKHIKYNVLIFALLFICFGLFVFIMVRTTIYREVDQELYSSYQKIIDIENSQVDINLDFGLGFKSSKNEYEGLMKNSLEDTQVRDILRKITNPNIVIIVRDLDGNIINDELGRIEDYVDQVNFDSKNLDKIYDLTIEKQYVYRGINFVLKGTSNENSRYIQLLINTNSERNLVDKYFVIILASVCISCVLSVLASYFLSKKTLKPLSESMLRQMEFVQNVSHELRTPLTIIQAKQELLLQDPKAKIIDKSEDIAVSLSETQRLSKLVKDLLIISRADSKKLSMQKENINIDEYIKEITSPYSEVAELEGKKVNFDLNYNQDINLDTNKIYQLMIILLDNAIKYTEENDEITIKTYCKDNKCIIEVQDTGIGVSDEGLNRIFERFYREDRARNRETGGSGLGLSIASVIVDAHNGTIKAIHNKPKGTCFIISLPRK